MKRASARGSGGTKSARASASVGRATAGRGLGGTVCWPEAGPVTIALAAPAAPAAAPLRNLRRSTELVDVLSTRLVTASPVDYRSANCVPAGAIRMIPQRYGWDRGRLVRRPRVLARDQLVIRTRLRPA